MKSSKEYLRVVAVFTASKASIAEKSKLLQINTIVKKTVTKKMFVKYHDNDRFNPPR
jgi:hypothetical protein